MGFQKFRTAFVSALLLGSLALVVSYFVRSTASVAATNNVAAIDLVDEIDGYKSWTKVNEVPQLMPGRVATDCAMWLSSTGVDLDGANNPHRNKYFTVYVNEVGRNAMLSQKHPKFGEGSVIVKEKLPSRFSSTPELLTVMIKHNKGFNPASGDWEYMVVDGSGTEVQGRGKLENCQACHVDHSKTDYVFRTYLPELIKRKLE